MSLEQLWRLIFPDPAQCFLCGRDSAPGSLCEACAEGSRAFQARVKIKYVDEVFALSPYRGEVRRRLHALKYWNRPAFARHFARAAVDLGLLVACYDSVTAVPMHRQRFIQRGYNQAELLAMGVAAQLRLPLTAALKRTVDTRPQHTLGRSARQQNLSHAFTLTEDVSDRRILLVDDILTTGATLSEAARMLKAGRAAQVDALVVAVSLVAPQGQ